LRLNLRSRSLVVVIERERRPVDILATQSAVNAFFVGHGLFPAFLSEDLSCKGSTGCCRCAGKKAASIHDQILLEKSGPTTI
jgi:hypothetical protein